MIYKHSIKAVGKCLELFVVEWAAPVLEHLHLPKNTVHIAFAEAHTDVLAAVDSSPVIHRPGPLLQGSGKKRNVMAYDDTIRTGQLDDPVVSGVRTGFDHNHRYRGAHPSDLIPSESIAKWRAQRRRMGLHRILHVAKPSVGHECGHDVLLHRTAEYYRTVSCRHGVGIDEYPWHFAFSSIHCRI